MDLSTTIFLAGIAIYAFGLWSDIDVSRRYVYYRKDEDNRWAQDEHGYLSVKKLWFLPAIAFGCAFGAGMLGHYFQTEGQWGNVGLLTAAAVLTAFGIGHWYISTENARHAKKNRIKQIALRAAWKKGIPTSVTVKETAGLYRYPAFAWITAKSRTALDAAITDWLALPESDLKRIWVDTRYHPK